MLYELAVAFAVGFIAGMIYEAERVSRLIATENGLKQFLLTHAPWHLKKISPPQETHLTRKGSKAGFLVKIVILALMILLILSSNELF